MSALREMERKDRVARIEDVLALNPDYGHLTAREAVIDTLTDLMHYPDHIGESFKDLAKLAADHHEVEK
jgi:hypothetical protein